MGKNLIQQARGKGGPTYRAPSHRYAGDVRFGKINHQIIQGKVLDILTCPGHSSPLAKIAYEDGDTILMMAPEGIKVGDSIDTGEKAKSLPGNITFLKDVPEGTAVFNIENTPGDGGKFVRASGTYAKVVSQLKEGVMVQLPSKKKKIFHKNCRASIGIIAGGGRKDKPFGKAGNKYFAKKAKNKLYPIVSGSAQNAVDHPFGNKRTSRKSKARPVGRNTPPGRKVGMLYARQTGRKRGKSA